MRVALKEVAVDNAADRGGGAVDNAASICRSTGSAERKPYDSILQTP
jgi:hypothetical protein